tara:strand:- start:5470 stop:7449 length:1980 start_codon:yes stop_codon:yes gene_type:complete
MCGIAGFLCSQNNTYLKNLKNLNNIKDILYHRGPDDHGLWYNNEEMISLGHTRLSIQDLSPAGHQPMKSFSKRYIMVYNGEIYNHLVLRNQLKSLSPKIIWKGKSDTETLLNSFDFWGIEKTLRMCSGMFSIALWDNLDKELILIRDRFGEKPLYFGIVENNFIFGSELKVFKKITNFTNEISRDSLNLFLRFTYVPGPKSIYKNIFKLQPGAFLKINKDNLNKIINYNGNIYEKFKINKWWNAKEAFNDQSSNLYSSEESAINDAEKLLTQSIKSQLISDVPVGTFLSGGIDSSLVSTLMKKKLSTKTKTFTIGFEDKKYDESVYAKKIAKIIGTEHNELILNQKEALNIIPNLSKIYDEPFADSSQIPTILLSKFAKQQITVALTGDGGDELFGGYNRYVFLKNFWNKISFFPYPIRKIFAQTIDLFPLNFINNFKGIFNLISGSNVAFFGDKVTKFSHKIKSIKNLDELFLSSLSTFQEPSSLLVNSKDLSKDIFEFKKKLNYLDYEALMMFIDSQTYLTDDILCKVDRASMSRSLETRVPFLDKDVVNLAWRIPTAMKIKNKEGKWILKKILNKYVPKEYFDRPKMGFGIPLGDWLRDDLREWAENLLNKKDLESEGYFNSDLVLKLWNEHQNNKRDWQSILWPILIFQSWKKEN